MDQLMLMFSLLVGHALCDYPLQGEFLALAKNHRKPIVGFDWRIALTAHALIHGGMVALLTRNVWLGIAETLVHIAIDWTKSDERITFTQDQALHVAFKGLWLLLA